MTKTHRKDPPYVPDFATGKDATDEMILKKYLGEALVSMEVALAHADNCYGWAWRDHAILELRTANLIMRGMKQ